MEIWSVPDPSPDPVCRMDSFFVYVYRTLPTASLQSIFDCFLSSASMASFVNVFGLQKLRRSFNLAWFVLPSSPSPHRSAFISRFHSTSFGTRSSSSQGPPRLYAPVSHRVTITDSEHPDAHERGTIWCLLIKSPFHIHAYTHSTLLFFPSFPVSPPPPCMV